MKLTKYVPEYAGKLRQQKAVQVWLYNRDLPHGSYRCRWLWYFRRKGWFD